MCLPTIIHIASHAFIDQTALSVLLSYLRTYVRVRTVLSRCWSVLVHWSSNNDSCHWCIWQGNVWVSPLVVIEWNLLHSKPSIKLPGLVSTTYCTYRTVLQWSSSDRVSVHSTYTIIKDSDLSSAVLMTGDPAEPDHTANMWGIISFATTMHPWPLGLRR